jgi:tRNA dimethylallyltransferase
MAMGEAAADESIRQELQQIADAPGGKEQLHQQLAAVDPDTAQRLHLNDVRRVIRALEVYRLTGRPFSQQPQIKTDSRFSYRVASLTMPRDILYARIEQRIDQMLADGLAEEVSRLLKGGVPRDAKAMKAIGYKEMIPYALGETTLDEAVYALKLNTRHYAKRQLTWMRREEDVLWVDALEPDAYDKLEAYYTQGEAK